MSDDAPVDYRFLVWKSVSGKILGRPVTHNDEQRGHWGTRFSKTDIWKRAARAVIEKDLEDGFVRELDVVVVQVTPTYLSSVFPDVGACAPTAKAVIDALVEVGIIPDDNPPHLARISYERPQRGTVDGLAVRVREGKRLEYHPPRSECGCRSTWERRRARSVEK